MAMLPLVGTGMVPDAIRHECRTSGQEWGEEITESFQGLWKESLGWTLQGQAEPQIGTQAASNTLGPERNTVLQLQTVPHLFLLEPGHPRPYGSEGSTELPLRGSSAGLFTY